MNATVRTIVVFLALVAAIVAASFMYRRVDSPPPAERTAERVEFDESALGPEATAGFEAMRAGDDNAALESFRAVTEDSADYPVALQRIAVLLARKGDYREAQAHVLELTKLQPDNPEPHALMGWLFYLEDDYARAELAALRCLELDPQHLSSRYHLGLYRAAQGRSQRAVASYMRALQEDPTGNELPAQIERLREYHERHPGNAAVHYTLAFLAKTTQDRGTEIEELEHYLQIASPGPEVDAALRMLEEARAGSGS